MTFPFCNFITSLICKANKSTSHGTVLAVLYYLPVCEISMWHTYFPSFQRWFTWTGKFELSELGQNEFNLHVVAVEQRTHFRVMRQEHLRIDTLNPCYQLVASLFKLNHILAEVADTCIAPYSVTCWSCHAQYNRPHCNVILISYIAPFQETLLIALHKLQ